MSNIDTYIFGDIEGNIEIYKNTIDCINKTWDNGRYIFLGDIYNPNNINDSIDIINSLSTYFWTNSNYINNDSNPLDIIRLFRKLWKEKGLKNYNTRYKQFWKSIPKDTSIHRTYNNSTVNTDDYDLKHNINIINNNSTSNINRTNEYKHNFNNFKYKFLFGNKEIEFISDLLASKNITKVNINDTNISYYNIPVKYINNKTKEEEEIMRTYTCVQLNILYNYLLRCTNYYIENGVLYTHCYFNCKLIKNINTVVSGHNKGYGKFKDSRYANITVYIIDITDDWNNMNNYMIYKNSTFKLLNNEVLPSGLTTLHK